MAYLCWGKDQEDLTPRLRSVLGSDFERRLMVTTVMVTCDDGHENTFGPPVGPGILVESRNDD